ncbi:MAG: zinc ribbon domain-containing protein [Thiohalocapsa sp.]
MPIYAYRCEDCGHELDALQKLSDSALTDCPECGAAALKKQITAAAFRLKGGGWYETDFKKDGKKNLHETGEKPVKEAAVSDGKADKKETTAAPSSDKPDKPTPTSEPKPKPKPKPKTAADA